MPTQTKVYLSREGSFLEPQPIEVTVAVGDGKPPRLDGSMPLDGFLAAVAARMPHPTTTWTRAQLAAALREAASAVVVTMKQEVARVM